MKSILISLSILISGFAHSQMVEDSFCYPSKTGVKQKIILNGSQSETLNRTSNALIEGDYFSVMLKQEYRVYSWSITSVYKDSLTKENFSCFIDKPFIDMIENAKRNKALQVIISDFVLLKPNYSGFVPFDKAVKLVY